MDTCNNLRGDIYIKSVTQKNSPPNLTQALKSLPKSIPGLKLANY